jgi:Ca2+-binding RTX toxin-like protein
MLLAGLAAAVVVPQAVSADNFSAGDPAGNVNLNVADVTTGGVQLTSPKSATLTGTIDPNSVGTSYYFEYGPNGDMSLRTATVSVGSSLDPRQVVADVPGLEPGTAYSYRLVASGPAGLSVGAAQTFQTASALGGAKSSKSKCTIRGTAKNDVLRGTRKRDVICGLGGNDVIRGLGGNDTIKGGAGRDRIFGDAGNDRLFGEKGNDYLSGGKGRDRIVGGPGKDSARYDNRDFKLRSVEKSSRR